MADVTIDASELEQDACAVSWDGNWLGLTEGGAEIAITPIEEDQRVDRYAERVNIIYFGEDVEVSVNLAQYVIEAMALAFPAGATTGSSRYFGGATPTSLLAAAKQLILRPWRRKDASDATRDLVLYLAAPKVDGPIGWTKTGRAIIKIRFRGLVDESRDAGKRVGHINCAT